MKFYISKVKAFAFGIVFIFGCVDKQGGRSLKSKTNIDSVIIAEQKLLNTSEKEDFLYSKYYILKEETAFSDEYAGVFFGVSNVNVNVSNWSNWSNWFRNGSLDISLNSISGNISFFDGSTRPYQGAAPGMSWKIDRNNKIFFLTIEKIDINMELVTISVKEINQFNK